MKKKRTIVFYTPSEEKRMIEVYKTSKNQVEAARILAKEFGRNVGNVQVKLSTLLRKGGSTNRSAKKNESKGVAIPKGFTFDIIPSKAVMFADHVRLYF